MNIRQKHLSLMLSLLVAFSFQIVLIQKSRAELTAIVRGTIKDKVTLEPIDGAIITTSGVGATISVNGEFFLVEVPGSWTLKARANGYQTYTQEITIGEEDELVKVDILMVPGDDAETTICPAELLYGEHSSEVKLLRNIRDKLLNKTSEGRELIRMYYQLSPVIIKTMEEDEVFKKDMEEMIDGVLIMIADEK